VTIAGLRLRNRSAGGFDNVPRLFGDDALTAWRKVTDGVHAVGGLFSRSCGTSARSATRALARIPIPP